MGIICYVEGHVDRGEFARMVERITGQPVALELVRHWYGRAVPLKLGETWGGRGHTFTAKPGTGAKKFTVYDAGAIRINTQDKRVKNGSKNDLLGRSVLDDLMSQKNAKTAVSELEEKR